MDRVVGAEGEDGERAVGLVARGAAHRLPPEVVPEQPGERRGRPHVRVLLDGEDVVVHQLARQAVEVAACSQQRGADDVVPATVGHNELL